MKNVPVLKLTLSEEERCWGGDSKFLYEKIKWFLAQNDAACMVLAMEGRRDPDYQELKKLAGDDLENIITRVRALKKADEQYNNFSGLEKGKTGSVRFIVETDEIKK